MLMKRTLAVTARRRFSLLFLALLLQLLCLASAASAQDSSGDGDAAQANNPLADFKAFNLQNYYVPELSELDGQNANTFWLRYAQPFGKWLFRGSLPIARVPTGGSSTTSGLGDLNVFFAYLFDTGNPTKSFGIGPQITLDTARPRMRPGAVSIRVASQRSTSTPAPSSSSGAGSSHTRRTSPATTIAPIRVSLPFSPSTSSSSATAST